jgi:hypothetical protein
VLVRLDCVRIAVPDDLDTCGREPRRVEIIRRGIAARKLAVVLRNKQVMLTSSAAKLYFVQTMSLRAVGSRFIMLRTTKVVAFIGMLCVQPLLASLAHAQATRTWVSGLGDDANPCTRVAPCKTFAGAISKTTAGGEISVLDPGGFGAVTITKSISITNDGAGEASILAPGTNAIIVNAAASDVINLRGLIIDGGQLAAAGLNGIRFIAGKALHIQNCVIKNFAGTGVSGFGIQVVLGGVGQLFVGDTVISNNGSGNNGGGVLIQPTGVGSAKVILERVQVEGNVLGLKVDGTNSTGTSGNSLVVRDSVVSGNSQTGISVTVPPGGQGSNIFVDHTAVLANGTIGILASGAATAILVSNSTITLNGTGIATQAGGSVFSYKNNNLNNNGTDGTFTPPALVQN